MANLKWNPNARKQTPKGQRANERNMNKFKLSGFVLQTRSLAGEILTQVEKNRIAEIKEKINLLLEEWDNNSQILGMKVERYDLYIKKENGEWEDWGKNLTKKHIYFLTSHINKEEIKIVKVK